MEEYKTLVTETIKEWKGKPVTIFPPTWIHDSVEIGEGTKIGPFCNIRIDVEIGRNNNIQDHCSISEGTVIGDGNFISQNTHIINDKYMNSVIQPPTIGNRNRIGACVLILPGVNIGTNCNICAKALITKDVLDGTEVLPKSGKKAVVVW